MAFGRPTVDCGSLATTTDYIAYEIQNKLAVENFEFPKIGLSSGENVQKFDIRGNNF